MKKKIGILVVIMVCFTFVSYSYLHKDKKETNEEESVYMKTVVFKDKEDELIPVLLNFHSQVELEQEVKNRVDLMKSNELESYGLYPILSEDLEVLSVQSKEKVLTINFNDELYSHSGALDILEALSFTMTDYDGIEQLKLQINGKEISYLPNSTLPTTCLTKNLGLNNFEETSALLHETSPVMVYNQKMINQYSYYVPTTMRVNENDDLNTQVKTILNHISEKIHFIGSHLKDDVLTIELDSQILLDNEKIDQTLEDLIVLSLTSLQHIKDVEIIVNGEDVRSKKTTEIQSNYIKI